MLTGRLSGGSRGDVAAAEHDPAAGRELEAADHPQRRRLAAAGRAEQREELAGRHVERDVVHGTDVAEPLLEAVEADLGGHAGGGGRHARRDLTRTTGFVLTAVLWRATSRARFRPRGDPRQRALPAGVERVAGLVEVDDDRRVVRRRRRALASLAVDLRPHDALGDGRRGVQEVDPHALVAVEHAGAVVPPREPAALRALGPVGVGEAPLAQRSRARRAPWATRGCRRAPASRSRRPRAPASRCSRRRGASGSSVDRRLVEPAPQRARTSAACPRRTASRRRARSGAYRLTTRTPPHTADTIRASSNGSKSSSSTR